jgi:hypothetical protein
MARWLKSAGISDKEMAVQSKALKGEFNKRVARAGYVSTYKKRTPPPEKYSEVSSFSRKKTVPLIIA